jgi:sphinganine-1-phosphate aldolase
MDPIADIAAIAEKHDLWMHVDACVGGFIAPFAKLLGEPIGDFDFAVPGVMSMSADLHKYGYAAKGASTVLYRDAELFKFQAYSFSDWPRGVYSTQTLVGTRAGGAIAAAWAVMNFLGEDGYRAVTRRILDTRKAIGAGVAKLGLEVWGRPELSILSYGSPTLDIAQVADRLSTRGWFVGRLVEPPGIHLMLNLTHEPIVGEYLGDLEWALDEVRAGRTRKVEQPATY